MTLRALVIEDSGVFQKIMSTILSSMSEVESTAVAGTGKLGLELAAKGCFDVIFLDMILPDMHGLDMLAELSRCPNAPAVIVVSAVGGAGTDLTIKALEQGALEFICKPSGFGFRESAIQLRGELKRALASVAQRSPRVSAPVRASVKPKLPPRVSPIPLGRTREPGRFWITALAASTGGPESLTRVVPLLPADYPTPIVIVQHMPALFTASLAKSLDGKSALQVVEAAEGMELERGRVYIAPGGRHMTVKRERGRSVVRLNDDALECGVRPSADVLFRSLATISDVQSVLAVIMTGMGVDGKTGVEILKKGQCHCMTQSEATCVVYGMPRAIDLLGLADESVHLDRIARRITELNDPALVRVP